jgi:hypothetical protein
VPGEKKVFVTIYCKIYTDSFSNEMVNRLATGTEIFNFLMKDAGLSFDEEDHLIPGDINLWYLGCKDRIMEWDFGESSFDRVKSFIILIYLEGVFTEEQYLILMEKINEGRQVDNMYNLPKYLIVKREGKPWVKTEDGLRFRDEMKSFVGRVKEHLKQEDFLFLDHTAY